MWRIAIFIFIGLVCLLQAAPLPLTERDVSLMLRSGYSSDAILRELAARHFVGVFDQETEKQLSKAGASIVLLDALRSGTYQLSGSELESAKQKIAAQTTAAAQTSHSIETQTVSRSAPSPPVQQQAGGTMYDHLKDDLVVWHNGSLASYDDEALQKKKFYLLFFSAIWSKEGRQFTTQLTDYYNRVAPQHPELEIVFFSADRSAFAMENYVSQTNMPWPAVAYDKLQGKAGALAASLTHQIPRLILADASGKMLSDSGEGQPDFAKVLSDLDKILNAGASR